jgi:hypothetical protein
MLGLLFLLLLLAIELPVTVAQVTSCSAGSYLSSGSCITCTDYTLGQCTGGTSLQTACASGQSPTLDFSTCITTPTTCQDGYLLQSYGVGSSLVKVCVPCFLPDVNGNYGNSICLNGSGQGCNTGVPNANATICVPALNPHVNPGCPFGEFVGNFVCRPCPIGKFCPGNYFPPSSCGIGKVLSADKTTCEWDGTTTCPAGTWSPIAFAGPVGQVTDPYCMSCPTNTICTGGSSLPTYCPAGTWPNSNSSATTCVVKTTCLAGSFLQNGGCPPCPSGFFCSGGTNQPAKCPLGLYPADSTGVSSSLSFNSFDPGMSTCAIPTGCRSGDFINATGCWPCPAGFSCIGNNNPPSACPGGSGCSAVVTYCSQGNYLNNGTCRSCFNGYHCPGGTNAIAIAVPEGYYTSTISGYFLQNGGILPNYSPVNPNNINLFVKLLPRSCPAGYYLQTNVTGCTPEWSSCTFLGCNVCPSGHVCAGGTATPVLCTGGTVPNWNSTLGAVKSFCVQPDVPCARGFENTGVKNNGFAAYNNYWQSYDNLFSPSCTAISNDFFTSIGLGGSTTRLDCQILFIANNDNTRCIPQPQSCPVGTSGSVVTWATLNNQHGVSAYGTGSGFLTKPTLCNTCTDDSKICPGGPLPASAISCPSGFQKSENFTVCVPATQCPAGRYSSLCIPCPPGHACLGDRSAKICGQGKLPAGNASTCLWDGTTSCSPGTWGTSASRFEEPYCQPCPMYATCAGGNALPVGCSFGTGPNVAKTACVVRTTCSAGMFLSNGRCEFCPAGYACSGGTSSPLLCPFNLVPMDANNKPAIGSPNHQFVDIAERNGGFPAISCEIPPFCPPGYFLNVTGCWPCPSGFACPGADASFYNCTGSYIPLPPSKPTYCGLLSAVTAPSSCSAGFYLPTGGKYCEPCPSGQGCRGNSQPVTCASPQVFNTDTGLCINPLTTCNAGMYLSNGLCLSCPLGAACPGGSASFTMCVNGTVQNYLSGTACVASPTSCPSQKAVGRYTVELGLPSGYIWLDWAQSEANSVPGLLLPCNFCQVNHVCPGGYTYPRQCPDNSSPDETGTFCVPTSDCPLGYAYDDVGGGGYGTIYSQVVFNSDYGSTSRIIKRCFKCSKSQLCPLGTRSSNPWPTNCNNGHASQNQTVCIPLPSTCPIGQAPLFGVCSACPTGYYCPGGSNSGYPPASDPVLCGIGKVPNGGATACDWDGTSVCAAGTYINPSTNSNADYCIACTSGNICTGGSAAPTACPSGQYVNVGATACYLPTSCNVGDYINGANGCLPCPSNSACAGGTATFVTCTSGQVPDFAKSACVAASTTCSSGTFLYQSLCLACPSGATCSGGTAGISCFGSLSLNLVTSCAACPANANCWGSSITCNTGYGIDSSGACIAIPPGPCDSQFYLNTTISNIPVCAECPPGKVCIGGGAAPITCPSPRVPDALVAAKNCVMPVTSCSSGGGGGGQSVVNGICVSSSSTTATCTGTPSSALITKCQTAKTNGGVNASNTITCMMGMGFPSTKSWNCNIGITGQVCSQPCMTPQCPTPSTPSYISSAMSTLCTTSSSCASSTGKVNFNGDGVTNCGGGPGGPGGPGLPGPGQICMTQATAANFANCTNSSNTVQCISGAWSCAPALSCSNMMTQMQCPTGAQIVCTNNVRICRACSTTSADFAVQCLGSSRLCSSSCTDRFCDPHQTCPSGQYLNTPRPLLSLSDMFNYSGTCISPASGSLSCPSGQFLVPTPFFRQTPWNSNTNPQPAMHFQCAPCPTGYICAGGTGAAAYVNVSSSGTQCPSTGTGYTTGSFQTGSGLTGLAGESSSHMVVFTAGTPVTSIQPISSPNPTYYCVVTVRLASTTWTTPGNYLEGVLPYVPCDQNFFMYERLDPNFQYTGSLCLPCPSGSYSPGGYTRICSLCSNTPPAPGSCPVGQSVSCSGGTWACRPLTGTCAAPTPCTVGTDWSNSGNSPCTSCSTCSTSVTSSCTATSDTVCASPSTPCTVGTDYSSSGSSPCTPCSTCSGVNSVVVSTCNATSNTVCGPTPSSPTPCVAGTDYSSSGSSPCTPCSTCSGVNSVVVSTCNATSNTVCGPTPSSPSSCSTGQYLSGSTCISCPAGTYQNSSSYTGSSCISCPSGTFGLGGSSTSSCTAILTCGAGNYSLQGAISNDVSNPTNCIACSSGLTSPSGSISSNACVAPVSSCNAGQYLSGSACVLCPAGSYQGNSSFTGSSCTSCPVGITTTGSSTGSISISSCTICAAGYAGTVTGSGTSNAAGCTICPLGKYAIAGELTCTDCPAGTYGSSTGLTTSTCTGSITCSAGRYALLGAQSSTISNTNVCALCPAGTISTLGSTSNTQCSTCGLGKYSLSGDSTCSDCPAGSFGSTSGLQNSTCSGLCPAGKYSTSGSSSCIDCSAGLTSPIGSISSNACVTPSSSCNAGQYLSGSACVVCPAGSYQSSSSFTGSSCTSCPVGISTTSSATGSISISSCTICAPGYAGTVQCPPFYANSATCSGTSNAAGCNICPLGKYALASASTCLDCPGGTYGSSTGLTTSSCSGTCGLGKYSTLGSSSCTDCPAGYYGATVGLTSSSCSGICPAGKYSTLGSSACSDCPAGLTSLPGSISSNACVTPASSCNAGSYLDQSTCVLCPPGSYQSLSSFTGSSCTSCPVGITTTGSSTGSISISACTICAPGYAGTVTGSGTSNAAGCTICPLGKYATAGLSSCINCQGGKYGATTGLQTSACSGDCAAGKFSTSGSSSCSDCPAGSFGSNAGSSGCSGICADGKYSLAGSSVCTDCPAGTWGVRGGSWPNYIGLTNASCSGTCPAGTTSAAGSVASNWCSMCVRGKYSLAGDPVCTNCPAGTWGQTIGIGNPNCSGPCPAGKYSLAGAFMCSDCPTGQTSPPGSTSSNACVPATPCVALSWSASGSAPCTACSSCFGVNSSIVTACTTTSDTVCGPPASCIAGSTWSSTGTAPCGGCSSCPPNSIVTSACTKTSNTICSTAGGPPPGGPNACVAGSTWSSSGSTPCNACSTCSGPNRIVSTTCTVTSDSICGCDSGSTKDAAGTGCLTTSVVALPYAISSPALCSSTGAINAILNPSSGVALSLRGNMSVALGIPASSTFIVAVTACDSTTTLVPQNAPINTAAVPGGLTRRRLQTAALNTSSLNLVINGQTLVITLGFTIPTSVAPAMSAFLSASMSGASPATLATLATNLQTSITSSGAASSPQLSSLLSSMSSTNPSSSSAATGFSKKLNSVPVFAAAPLASSLGVSVTSLGITNDTVKGVPSAIAVYGNPLAVAPTTPSTDSGSSTGGLGGLGALVLLVILPACGYYFLVYRKKKQEDEKKKGSDSEDDKKMSKNSGIDSGDISFDIVSPMRAGETTTKKHKESTNKASFEPRSTV